MTQPAPALRTPPRAIALPLQIRRDFGELAASLEVSKNLDATPFSILFPRAHRKPLTIRGRRSTSLSTKNFAIRLLVCRRWGIIDGHFVPRIGDMDRSLDHVRIFVRAFIKRFRGVDLHVHDV